MKLKNLLIVLVAMLLSTFSYSQDFEEVYKAVASDRTASDIFGRAVCISGNVAIIAPNNEDHDASGGNYIDDAGSAYIFERNENGEWNQIQKIVASDRDEYDYFGRSVSVSDNYIVVGAPSEDHDASGNNPLVSSGSAYIFEYNGNGLWNEVQKIVAFDRDDYDTFGEVVSISSNKIIIAAPQESEDESGGNTVAYAGSAYIFERDQVGNWNLAQKIVASDRGASDAFSISVAISGNYVIIGAYRNDEDENGGNSLSDAGAAYLFECDGSGVWTEVQKIVASDRDVNDNFGQFVAISGNYAVVCSPNEEEDASGGNTMDNAGSAYIFERDGSGQWNEVQKIVPSDRATDDYFGESISISGNYIIIGARLEDEDESGGNTLDAAGSAYIFERDEIEHWNEVQKINNSDRETGDVFGSSVGISGNYAVIGAIFEEEDASGQNTLYRAGSAYIFEACEADFGSDPDNVIENPIFETCILNPWELYYAWHFNTLATYQLIDGTCIVIPSHLTSSPELWHIQLQQPLSTAQIDMLEQGKTYTLTFDSWSEANNMDCHIYFGQNEDPWTPLLDQMIELNTSSSTYSYDFTMSQVYPLMKLTFEIGTETTWAAFDNVSLVKKAALGTQELSDRLNFKIIPNPATDNLDIFAEAGSNIRIYNCSGILIQEFVAYNHRTTYETSGLDKGVYFITISKNNQITTEKIIIQ